MMHYTVISVVLIILSVCLTLGALLYIGKFFCVDLAENLYKEIEYDYEAKCFYHFGYISCLICTSFAWIVYVFDIGLTNANVPLICILCLVFSSLFALIFMIIFIYNLISACIVPTLEEIHRNIKLKKRG